MEWVCRVSLIVANDHLTDCSQLAGPEHESIITGIVLFHMGGQDLPDEPVMGPLEVHLMDHPALQVHRALCYQKTVDGQPL